MFISIIIFRIHNSIRRTKIKSSSAYVDSDANFYVNTIGDHTKMHFLVTNSILFLLKYANIYFRCKYVIVDNFN